jgi:hypothetical protein
MEGCERRRVGSVGVVELPLRIIRTAGEDRHLMAAGDEPLDQVIDAEGLGPEILRDDQEMHDRVPREPSAGREALGQSRRHTTRFT